MPTWDSAADWDAATSESGVEHESVAGTANDDASSVEQGYSYTEYQVTPDPVAHYPLQETSGSTANDVAGTNDATINGATPNGATGPLGVPAYLFDGVDDYVNTGVTVPSPTTELTWAAWVRPDATDEGKIIGFSDGGSAGDFSFEAYQLLVRNGELMANVNSASESSNNIFGPSVTAGDWHHVAAVVGGGSHEFFVDGVSQGTANFELTPEQNPPIGIGTKMKKEGSTISTTTGFFHGPISDVRLYDHALTTSEVETLYDVVAGTASLTTATK